MNKIKKRNINEEQLRIDVPLNIPLDISCEAKDWMCYEKEAKIMGYGVICGIDEAGRGPLAGPVCAAAVIMSDGLIDGLDDSKKLSAKKRAELYNVIQEKAIGVSVGFADEKEIDEINILNATFLAMKRAVDGLKIKPEYALIDGNMIRGLDIPCRCIVKGDGLSSSIAAASVIAKESRDAYMKELDGKYPMYGFAKHMGYPTKAHYEAIMRYGISDCHRKSFLKKFL